MGRSDHGRCGANSWHVGGSNIGDPTLAIGDGRAAFRSNVSIGTYSNRLYVSGASRVPGTSYATSHTKLSDASLKEEVEDASENQCMDLL